MKMTMTMMDTILEMSMTMLMKITAHNHHELIIVDTTLAQSVVFLLLVVDEGCWRLLRSLPRILSRCLPAVASPEPRRRNLFQLSSYS